MKGLLVAIAIVGVAHAASAQGIPALGAAKRAANNAANATNASISEQTGQELTRARGTGTVNTGTTNTASAQLTTKSGPGVPPGAVAKNGQPAPDSSKGAKPASADVAFSREVYSYDAGGRRDPFLSLLASGDLRPSYSDLRLVAVAYDPTGRKSVAVMRDVSTKDQYRVKVGQTLGRMRVAQIHPKSVTFTIDEFGYSRQEILALGDSTTRTP
jgi:hypothetical protein